MNLSTKQLRILQALADSALPLTRSQMEPVAGLKGYSEALGSPKTGIRPESLEAMGLVERLDDHEPYSYRITAAGLQALRRPEAIGGSDEMADEGDQPASAYLLTWNPDHFQIGGDAGVVPGTEQQWTCHSKQPKLGDTVYLIRLGVEPRGIVARGTVTSRSFEAPHWKDPTRQTRYIRFKVEEFRPSAESGLLPMVLLSIALPGQKWSPQSSGIGLSETIATRLKDLWEAGSGIHSLRQFVQWITTDPRVRRDDWLGPYRETVALACRLREVPTQLDEAALDKLWRIPSNGVASVGPGALSTKDFQENLPLLTTLTREILSSPRAATLVDAEVRWQQAVESKALTKLNRAVIRRVFAAAHPESFTTILRDSDCHRLLAFFKRQFELAPASPSTGDWVGLNADLTSCMQQAGLSPSACIENNVAAWQLVEYLTPRDKEEGMINDAVPSKSGVGPVALPVSGTTPVNLVLYGPPGTGKTYRTVEEALALLDPELFEGEPSRATLKSRFDALVGNGQIVFTTFHQSFSYEDFVEGLRAETDEEGRLHYRVVDGVFKRICHGPAREETGHDSPTGSTPFRIGESFSGYQVKRATTDVLELTKPRGRDLPIGMSLLNELARLVRSGRVTLDDIRDKQVLEKVPDSTLEPFLIHGYNNILPLLVERLVATPETPIAASQEDLKTLPRVLIIDEINRGNVARIFGELITLIEPSKRAGMPEALTVTLPYSKQPFSVPANLHIIATMNSADRSLVGLDIALRRRFEFREMQPDPSLLDEVFVEGLSIGDLIRVLNERIELLLDRDHRLGHAYFLSLRESPTIEHLARVFRSHVLPLLQEYFFEDWQRIRWVLNDHRKPEHLQFIVVPHLELDRIFGSNVSVNEQNVRWHVNDDAFANAASYAALMAV